jgi:hypothetical protein
MPSRAWARAWRTSIKLSSSDTCARSWRLRRWRRLWQRRPLPWPLSCPWTRACRNESISESEINENWGFPVISQPHVCYSDMIWMFVNRVDFFYIQVVYSFQNVNAHSTYTNDTTSARGAWCQWHKWPKQGRKTRMQSTTTTSKIKNKPPHEPYACKPSPLTIWQAGRGPKSGF